MRNSEKLRFVVVFICRVAVIVACPSVRLSVGASVRPCVRPPDDGDNDEHDYDDDDDKHADDDDHDEDDNDDDDATTTTTTTYTTIRH